MFWPGASASSASVSRVFTPATPMMKTPTPMCATSMPQKAAGSARARCMAEREAAASPDGHSRSRSSASAEAMAQMPMNMPMAKSTAPPTPTPPSAGLASRSAEKRPEVRATSTVVTMDTPSAQRSRRSRPGTGALRQRATGPTPIRNTAGAISGTNTASK